MPLPANFPPSPNGEYICLADLDLFDSPQCDRLATQAAKTRQLTFIPNGASLLPLSEGSLSWTDPIPVQPPAMPIMLSEDRYDAWLPSSQLPHLQPATQAYQAIALTRQEITLHLAEIIAFTYAAKAVANVYLWGGNLGPNYDCSGLIQAAFVASGIWLPRDSYQQAAFTQPLQQRDVMPGDLIFFGQPHVNHVALYLGQGNYIHSSGPDKGRNGIAIDSLTTPCDAIATAYVQQLRGFGRVMTSFNPAIDRNPPN